MMLSATMTLSKSEAAVQNSLRFDRHEEKSLLYDSRHVCLRSRQTLRLPLRLPVYSVGRDCKPVSKKYLDLVSSDLNFANEVIQDPKLQRYCFNENSFQDIYTPGNVVLLSRHKQNQHKPKSQQRKTTPVEVLLDMKQSSKDSSLKEASLLSLFHRNKLLGVINEYTEMVSVPSESLMTESLVSTSTTHNANATVKPALVNTSNYTGKNIKTVSFNVSNSVSGNIMYKLDVSKQSTCRTDGMDQNLRKSDNEIEHQNLRTLHSVHNDWDDYMLCQVSASTAHWIVQECIPESKQRVKLTSLVQSFHGRPSLASLMLKEDSIQDEDEQKKCHQKHLKKWRKKEAIVLDKVYRSLSATEAELGQDRLAEVAKKEQAAHAGAQNQTKDTEVSMAQKVEAAPPKMQNFLGPTVGANLLETDKLYRQEQLTGRRHVYSLQGDPSEILLETSNRYKKQLQQEMPLPEELWHSSVEPDSRPRTKLSFRITKPKRGMKRWVDLPVLVNERDTFQLSESEHIGSRQLAAPSASIDTAHQHVSFSIVSGWFKKWRPSGYYPDRPLDCLLQDLADIQSSVRLQAIAAIARMLTQHSTRFDATSSKDTVVRHLGEAGRTVYVALECLLEDNHQEVRKAAAVTLSTFSKCSDKAKLILTDMLISECRMDRWASAGCLAVTGGCDSHVIAEIIKQVTSAEYGGHYKLGINLLARISNQRLVHCLVSEQLNSSSCHDRATACRILAYLPGDLSKEISTKLVELMWCDWHDEVRTLSACCLARKHQGQLVHNSIQENLQSGSELKILEALQKIGQLGVMTVRLLPPFLQCFSSPCPSIRAQVCVASGSLQIQDEKIMARLLDLSTSDPSWRVKVVAIHALGKIGLVREDIRDGLVWALRFETEAAVRAVACHSLVILKVKDADLITTLQDCLLLESSQLVRDEIKKAFDCLSVNMVEDSETLSSIKSEIQKLCQPQMVASQILAIESADTQRHLVQDMAPVYVQDGEKPARCAEIGLRSRFASPESRLQGQQSANGVEKEDDQQACQTTLQQIDNQTDQTVDKERSRTLPSIHAVEGKSYNTGYPLFKFDEYEASNSSNLHMVGLDASQSELMPHSADSSELLKPSQSSPNLNLLPPSLNLTDLKPRRADSSHHLAGIQRPAGKMFCDQKFKSGAGVDQSYHQNIADIYDNFEVRYATLADDLMTADKGLNMTEFFSDESIASRSPQTPNGKIENTLDVIS